MQQNRTGDTVTGVLLEMDGLKLESPRSSPLLTNVVSISLIAIVFPSTQTHCSIHVTLVVMF
jgi:hypothetical protein